MELAEEMPVRGGRPRSRSRSRSPPVVVPAVAPPREPAVIDLASQQSQEDAARAVVQREAVVQQQHQQRQQGASVIVGKAVDQVLAKWFSLNEADHGVPSLPFLQKQWKLSSAFLGQHINPVPGICIGPLTPA